MRTFTSVSAAIVLAALLGVVAVQPLSAVATSPHLI
jgi:hypothetical protein